jgi:hypothetical protein
MNRAFETARLDDECWPFFFARPLPVLPSMDRTAETL